MLRLHGAAPEASLPQPSADFEVMVDNQSVFVHGSPVPAAFCSFELRHPVTFRIRANRDVKWVDVRPASAGVRPVFKDSLITLRIDRPMPLSVELNGSLHHPLFLFANPVETRRPDPADPHVHFFRAGKGYHPGVIEMQSGETVFIEEGAVVVGSIHAKGARHIRIAGRGVLDGKENSSDSSYHRAIDLEDSEDITIEDLTLHNSNSWQRSKALWTIRQRRASTAS